ncbi:MAG: DUF3833 family protein [Hyphomicrobiaceae bacterium]
MPNDMSPIEEVRDFTLTSFLEGRTLAWGTVEDRFGRIRTRLYVEMLGYWADDGFKIDEDFHYDDGRHESRTWHVTPGGNGAFTATCSDCVGRARGTIVNGQIHMSYKFRLRLKRRTVVVHFSDRIIRIDDQRAVNRATIRKWGVRVGELALFFERQDDARRPGLDDLSY